MAVKGYVYVLTNPSFAFIKIGYSERDPKTRADELFVTGVPTPFEVAYEVLIDNPSSFEKIVHEELRAYRVSSNREFFSADPLTAIEKIRKALKNENILVHYEFKYIPDLADDPNTKGKEIINHQQARIDQKKERLKKLPSSNDLKYLGLPFWRAVHLSYGNPFAKDVLSFGINDLRSQLINLFDKELVMIGHNCATIISNRTIPIRFFCIENDGKFTNDELSCINDATLTFLLCITEGQLFHISDRLKSKLPSYYQNLPRERTSGEVSKIWCTIDNTTSQIKNIIKYALKGQFTDFPAREIIIIHKFLARDELILNSILESDAINMLVSRICTGGSQIPGTDIQIDCIRKFLCLDIGKHLTNNHFNHLAVKIHFLYSEALKNNNSTTLFGITFAIFKIYQNFRTNIDSYSNEIFMMIIHDKNIRQIIEKLNSNVKIDIDLNQSPINLLNCVLESDPHWINYPFSPLAYAS
jgi:hypothetical protein